MQARGSEADAPAVEQLKQLAFSGSSALFAVKARYLAVTTLPRGRTARARTHTLAAARRNIDSRA